MSQEASVAKVSQSDGSATIVPLNPSARSKKAWAGPERDITDPLGQLAVYRALSRVWRSNLSSPELSVLLYLIDQTVGIGVATRTLTVRGMNRGADKATGLGMSDTQLRAHLHNLENKGFILVDADKSTGFTITVNCGWTPKTVRNEVAEEGEDMLSSPKRLQNELSSRVETEEEGWGNPTGKPATPLPENRRTPYRKTGTL